MSRTLLIECAPRLPTDGSVTTRRMVWKARTRADFLGQQWHPVVLTPPSWQTSLGWDGRTFGARPSPQVGQLVFAITGGLADAARLVWTGAAVTIRAATWAPGSVEDPADGAFSIVCRAEVDNLEVRDGLATLTLIDAGKPLREPLAVQKFGQTGNALLDAATADRDPEQVVPRAFGRLFSVPGLLVDRVNNIWLIAADPASSVQAIYDGGAAFTLGAARASLAALQGNVPARGAADYCLNAGGLFLVRLWDQPVYPLTVDATFGSMRAADIAQAIVAARTSLSWRAGTLAAFNTAQPAPCGVYVDDDSSVATVLDRLFSGLGSWWKMRSQGELELGQWAFRTPVLTVSEARRGAPERLRVLAPTGRRTLGYARNNRVHGESEIAQILLADRLAYADGTPIEDLRPADPGATLGDNRLQNALILKNADGYNLASGSWARVARPGWPVPWVFQNTVTDMPALSEFQSPFAPVVGGSFVWGVITVERAAALSDLRFRLVEYEIIGGVPSGLGAVAGAELVIVPPAPNTPTRYQIRGKTSRFARLVQIQIDNLAGATIGTVWIGGFIISSVEEGADVTTRLIGPPDQTILCNHLGDPLDGQLPRTLQAAVTQGGENLTSIAALALSVPSGVATIDSSGAIELEEVPEGGAIQISGTLYGRALEPVAFNVRRSLAPPPAGGGGSAGTTANTSTFIATTTSDAFVAVINRLTIKTGSAGAALCSAPLQYFTTSGLGVRGKWRYRVHPSGSWSDVGGEITQSFPPGDFAWELGAISYPGEILVNHAELTGLSANTDYDFELLMANPTGAASAVARSFAGTATVVGR